MDQMDVDEHLPRANEGGNAVGDGSKLVPRENNPSAERSGDGKREDVVSRPSSSIVNSSSAGAKDGALSEVPYANRVRRQKLVYEMKIAALKLSKHSDGPLLNAGDSSVAPPYTGKSTKSSFNNRSSENGHSATPYSNRKSKKSWSNYKQSDMDFRQMSSSYSQNSNNNFNKNHKPNRWKYSRSLLDAPNLTDSTKDAISKLLHDENITEVVTEENLPTNQNDVTENVAVQTPPTDQNAECTEPSDFSVLNKMTAIEFDRDRYARFGIHESEIKDGVRTDSFLRCIELCASKHIKGKVVLVIRCGIGFLPLLCVRYGFAKTVIGLEQSACIEYARRIVKDNYYSDRITLIQSSVQDLKELPHGLTKVDVIVSDCLGDCVLGQGDQMEQVIEARDRFLRSKGLMIPLIVSLYCQLSEQRRAYENCRIRKKKKMVVGEPEAETNYDSDGSSDSNYSSWWSNVYGFDMRSNPEFVVDQNPENGEMNQKWRIMPEPLNSYFNHCRVVSSSALLKQFNLKKCNIEDLRYFQCKDAVLKCITPYTSNNGGDYAHMIELFMTVDFPNGKGSTIGFSTSSSSPCTRHKQTGLLLRDQLLVLEGDKFIINEFSIQRGPQQNKSKDGTTTIYGKTKQLEYEESLKLRLNYTFVNKYIKAIDRRCAYTVTKYLF